MEAKHTPGPWKIDGYRIRAGDKTIADLWHACSDNDLEGALANAEFITRACNAHDELVAALKQFMMCQTPNRQVICQPNAADFEMGRRALAKAGRGKP